MMDKSKRYIHPHNRTPNASDFAGAGALDPTRPNAKVNYPSSNSEEGQTSTDFFWASRGPEYLP
jgi:hypothetical protein